MLEKNIVLNRSKTYLLPLLSELVNFDMKFMKSLLNTYMYVDTQEYDNCLCILHEFNFKDPEFTSYEHRLTKNELFVRCVDIGNKVLYIFKFPDIYMKEYNLFKEGKYSEFGSDAKELILNFWADVHKGNKSAVEFLIKVKQILNKEDKLKQIIEKQLGVILSNEQELGEISDPEKETFKLNIYDGDKRISEQSTENFS